MRINVDIDGTPLEVEHRAPAGAGETPLVLLHPWFGCWQFWDRTVASIPELETYAVNLYSLGNSDDWERFASPQGLSRAVATLLDRRGIARCHLMGNSMGGIAAQHLAAQQPDRIESLILVGTGARIVGVKPEWRRMLDEWIGGDEDRAFTEDMVATLLARRPADPQEFATYADMVAHANKAFMGNVLSNAFELDLRPDLPKVRARTLVVRGALDAARTPAHVAEILAGIPGSQAVEIPGGGHSPQVDSPDLFADVVRKFLNVPAPL